MKSSRRLTALVPVALVVVMTGCSRQPSLSFRNRQELDSLPKLHRETIETTLLRLYGTPHRPLMRTIVLPDEEAMEASDDDPSASDRPAPDATSTVQYVDLNHDENLQHGAVVYNARCAGCHGITGDGQGEVAQYLLPKPRDYRNGVFKFTSTPYGAKPARHDLVRTIRRGAKGTSMPAFPWMTDEDLDAVIDYVIMLSTRGEVERYVIDMSEEYAEDEPLELFEFLDAIDMVRERWVEAEQQVVLPLTAEPPMDDDSIATGFALFRSQGCSKCHGEDGKGQTEWLSSAFIEEQNTKPEDERVAINYDAWGQPAPAADITARLLHGGRRPIDLYRRIHTGINGTPMPAFGTMFSQQPDHTWHLVHYILHIIQGGAADLGSDNDAADESTEPEPNQAAGRQPLEAKTQS